MLDFRINTFLMVCKFMNFTKAAEEICITQPAVSQHINHLEKLYNTKFFEYEGKKIKLTNSGKLFYKIANRMKHDETCLRELINQNKLQKKKLKFGATLTIGEFIIPTKLHRYIKNTTEVDVEMIVANTKELLNKLDQGEIDFVFVEGNFDKNEYDYLVYSEENFICVKGNNYKLPNYIDKIEDLMEVTLIVREKGSGTRDILEKNLELKNLLVNDFQKVMEVGNMNVIKYFIEKNEGITFLYEAAVKDELERGTIRELEIKNFAIQHKLFFIWRKNSVFEETYKEFCYELQK